MTHMKLSLTNERGGAGPKAIIAIAVLIAVIYSCIQLIPIYWRHWSFEDALKEQVRFLFVNVNSDYETYLHNFIITELDLMRADYDKEKNIHVKVDMKLKRVDVKVWYSRTVKLPFFPNPKQFYVEAENTMIQ